MDSDQQDSKIQTINGDITKVTKGIVCHQVNCMGKMGAGVALQIRKTWPTVYDEYIKVFKSNDLKLGTISIIPISEQLFIANLCGQYYYGRTAKHTNYDAVYNCLALLNYQMTRHNINLDVYFPYKMGCNLAGGNWNIIETIIRETITNNIIIVDPKGAK